MVFLAATADAAPQLNQTTIVFLDKIIKVGWFVVRSFQYLSISSIDRLIVLIKLG
jgi:hypothetical protein